MSDLTIVHRPEESRFEAAVDGAVVGRLEYALIGGTVDLHHTFVDPSMRGHGVAGQLVEEALRELRAEKLHVRPSCPYVAGYIEDHPEHQSLLEPSLVVEDTGDGPQVVPIRDESIRLGQLLKLANLVQDGAMARMVVEHGEVTVDGETVVRRGTQVRPGQVVEYDGQQVTPARG